jgi:hypothetical protein
MEWFLVIYLFSSDEVLLKQFNTLSECDKEADEVMVKYQDEKDIRQVSCLEGKILEKGDINAFK